jgi:hypothetical protein
MVIKTPNGRKTQIWWFDQQSYTIKTKLNNQSFDIKSAGKTNDMQIWSTNSQWFQIFKYDGSHFHNVGNNKVLDVKDAKDDEGQAVIVSNDSGKDELSMKWNVVYLDKAKPVPTKGFNKEFGWHINRPFYMVSRLPFKRVIESIGANNMVIKRYAKGRLAQQFWFDEKSKTIRSQQWKNYCVEIQSNGGSTNVRMTSGITSRWW